MAVMNDGRCEDTQGAATSTKDLGVGVVMSKVSTPGLRY